MRGDLNQLERSLSRRLLPLAYVLVAVVAFIVALTWGALQVQITLAGLMNGESIWSKAQKQVVIDLASYVTTGEKARLEDFRRNYDVLTSDAWARDAIASGRFDRKAVEAAFHRGSVIDDAIPGMIFIFEYLEGAPYIRDALHEWHSVDSAIAELGRIGSRLQHQGGAAGLSPDELLRLEARIQALNLFIEPHANRFSLEIALGAAWAGRVLFAGVIFAAFLALALWLLMARRTLARIRGTEERYRLLFDSAADAIVMVDEGSGRILDANRTTSNWLGRELRELFGAPFSDLFAKSAGREGAGAGALRGQDGERPVETHSSLTMWGERVVRQAIIRDISERVEREKERAIASEALAGIAEGVIIADADRRVLSINAAVTHITGFTTATLQGLRFDDARSMPDGSSLPQSVWDEIAAGRHWVGEVQSLRADGGSYPEMLSISAIRDSAQQVQHYVAVFSDISQVKADRRRLEHLATHDPLTGLVNRAEFERLCNEAIAHSDRERSAAAVLFIDLDAFKFVNDSYSHGIGDRLLVLVAERIQRQLARGDVAGRIGGDEFTVLARGLILREDAAGLASRLLATLSEPFVVEDYEIVLSASIGVAGFPLDGNSAPVLIANADAAMYAAKTEERNAYRFYAPMMHADTRKRLQLASELRQALLRDEFRLVFQPSIELRSGRIVAVEALLRWQHPERGEVMPSEFIPIAESTGVIHRIDEWVMRTVCAQIQAWDRAGVPQIRVAMNVSARWFGHTGFIESVNRALQSNGVAPHRVLLEITEGAMLRLGEDTERKMQALERTGVAVAIDDFGTGYSSMAYLKLPAVTYLKIDRSFISSLPDNTNDAAITTAMLAMAKSLGLIPIAEGIETEAQHE
ncbi:MAG TPA: EAL domain-containing protein, partial [Rhodanobacteraceae bacterium]|nr:EAL domain-containing protein [Rhodanobacteraceae bacterium]